MSWNAMSSDAIDIVCDRLKAEEAFRAFPYNDATGERVTCRPGGFLTWLYGLNLEIAATEEFADAVMSWYCDGLDEDLSAYDWYRDLGDVRKSVLLDMAFNVGVEGLLGFTEMIAALSATPPNYAAAADQILLSVAAHELRARYDKLSDIMRAGTL